MPLVRQATGNALFEEVVSMQALMNAGAEGDFSEFELESLTCVVRLTVEFAHNMDVTLDGYELTISANPYSPVWSVSAP